MKIKRNIFKKSEKAAPPKIKAAAPSKVKGKTNASNTALGKPRKRITVTWRSLQKDIDEPTKRRQSNAKVEPRRLPGNPITVGSDCAGLLSEGTALDMLGIKHEHVFASEANVAVRHLLYDTYGKKSMTYYKDVCRRDNTAQAVPSCDIYVFGFPCTPYSPAGLGQGLMDKKGRGDVLFHCLDYVKHKRPAVVIAENSHRFASSRLPTTIQQRLSYKKQAQHFSVSGSIWMTNLTDV